MSLRVADEFPGELRTARTEVLEIAYFDSGPADAPPVLLLHGFPYDVHSFSDVVPLLGSMGFRSIVPFLRGHGMTRALEDAGRSGQQAALGDDVIGLLDALELDSALFAGFDWGARAGCVAAALAPERCAGLVSVNGYLIQDIAASEAPLPPQIEAGLWYFFYFATERGRAGLEAHRREVARVIWTRNSPAWQFLESDLERASKAFDNPDYVDIVIHSYRHRLGLAPGHPRYDEWERALAALPSISAPTVTVDGMADGNFPATDGSGYARHLSGPHEHRQVPNAGHNLPQESPSEFADAVLAVSRMGAARSTS